MNRKERKERKNENELFALSAFSAVKSRLTQGKLDHVLRGLHGLKTGTSDEKRFCVNPCHPFHPWLKNLLRFLAALNPLDPIR